MKKKAALFFVFITNIILLGHAVVPHHHIELQTFLISSLCADAENDHHHPFLNVDHDHDHGDKPDTENCVLSQIVGIPSNMLRQAYISKTQIFLSVASFKWDYLRYNDLQPGPICEILALVRPPILSFTYTKYASAVLGLRAPPES